MKILIVEDEALIASVMKRVLRRDHEVTVVDDLASVPEGTDFDVVFCDVGSHDARTIRRHLERARSHMVLMSGVAPADPEVRRWIANGEARWMAKPFQLDGLRELLMPTPVAA